MIDMDELYRKLRANDLVDHIGIHANVKVALTEILHRLEAAKKEVAHAKEVEFPRKLRVVVVEWETKYSRLEQERDTLRARIEEQEDSERLRLRMRLELDAAQAEAQHLRGCIARLLRYTSLRPGITARSFSKKNTIVIEVPARAFATASGIAHKYNLEAEK